MHSLQPRSGGATLLGGAGADELREGRAWLDEPEIPRLRSRLLISFVLTAQLVAIAVLRDGPRAAWLELALATPVVAWAALPFFERAVASIGRGRPNMFALISLGALTAYIYSAVATFAPRALGAPPLYFGAAACAVTLVLAGEAIERVARRRAAVVIADDRAFRRVLAPRATHIEDVADRVSAGLVPVVLGVAAITFVGWLVFGPAPRFSHAIASAVAVLVIACPAAIGLATPTAFLVATAAAKSAGIGLRDAATTETLAKVTTLVVDRTSVLGEGRHEYAQQAIDELRRMGVRVVMMTSAARAIGQAAGRQLGLHVADVYAQIHPDDRAKIVAKLALRGEIVAVVSSAGRHAGAASAAHVGITLGAGEHTNISLPAGDLAGVVRAVRLARRTARSVRQNLALAFGYNLLAIPIAAGACYAIVGTSMSPMLAAGAMGLGTVSVIANSLRLLRR